MNRRAFLAFALSACSGCLTRNRVSAGIVDTHVHFYDPARPQGVAWPPSSDTLLHRTVLPAELDAIARPLGVAGCVIVEASPVEEDNQWVLDLARDNPFILGVVGHLKPGRPGFRAALARFARNPLFRGIRTGLWQVDVAPGDPAFVDDLRDLAARGLSLDVGSGLAQMEQTARLAAILPDLKIVLNHFGGPRIDGTTPDPRWLSAMRAAAAYPQVSMKLSGLVEGTARTDGTAPADPGPYRPWFDAVVTAFGTGRLLFGSNWPVSARFAPFERVLGVAQSLCEPADMDAVFRRNALRIYGLG